MKPETKYKGSIKLSAIGDALGWITEFEKSQQSLKEKFGTERIENFYTWKKTVGGRLPYTRHTVATAIAWADRIARNLYNLSATSTIAQLIWMHTTPTSTAANDKRKRLAEINERQQKSSAASSTRNSAK